MNRSQAPDTRQAGGRPRGQRRLLAADWARLSPEARDQAIEITRHEGRRATRWYLAEVADGNPDAASLRHSPWAHPPGSLGRLYAPITYMYATTPTRPGGDNYF